MMINQIKKYKEAASILPGSVLGFQLEEDDSMKVLFYSQKAQEITGMDKDEVNQTIHEDGLNMIVNEDQKVIAEKIKYAIEHKTELDAIYRQHHKVQGIVWIHMKATISGELDGKPVFIATMLDVTAEMLNSSSIMEATDRCICVIEKHTKRMLYGNTKFYELIDRKPSESILGAPCFRVLCGAADYGRDEHCLCFSTVNIEQPFEYYNPDTKKYISMYGREIMWGEHEAYVFFLNDQTEEKFKEKQLKNAQERFEMTLDNSDLYIWEYDMINNQCLNPQKAVREYGLPPVIDNYPESLFEMGHTPPETVEQIKEVKQRLLKGETGFSVERRTINGDGQSQWMKVSYTLEKDASGRPARALVCGTDITEQKRKEQEYEEEIRLKKMVTNDTTILCVLDLTLNKVVINDAQSPVLEPYLRNNTTIDDIMNSICDNLVVPSDRDTYRTHFSREHMLSDYEHGIMHGTFQHQFLHRVGWFESAYDLLQNPMSGNVEAIASIKDVTDEVRSRKVVNKLTAIDYDTIMTIDVETEKIYLYDKGKNSGAYTGEQLDAEEFKKTTCENARKYCTPEDAQRIIDDTQVELMMEKLKITPVYTTTYLMTINDKPVHKRNIYTYLDDSHTTILCASQDVTESYLQEEMQRKELSDALKRAEVANHAKTSFLSRVSHDMRTPMNGILGIAKLSKGSNDVEELRKCIKTIEGSGTYLLGLINDTLDLQRIESGRLSLHPEPVLTSEVMQNIVKMVTPSAEEKGVKFQLTIKNADVDCYVNIDSMRMKQIFMNLISNAIKFTPKGGLVDTCFECIGHTGNIAHDVITISDTGIGMSEEFIQNKIFQPFSQENNDATMANVGSGLGLSIVKNLVEMMNGTISVESEMGVGSKFVIHMDFERVEHSDIETVKRNSNVDSILQSKKILLAEDHPLNAEIAKKILEKKLCQVVWAKDGNDCLELFKSSTSGEYDAILMDIRMPVMNGMEATRAIRKLDRSDAAIIPIIAMTANAFEEDKQECIKAGMNEHISKPIDVTELYDTLAKYLSQ